MLIGHKQIFEKLCGRSERGSLHHAQIFLGPKHVGKSKVALLLAMQMQCPDESQVILRKQIADGADSDTVFFHDDGEVLEIEKVRGIVARSSITHVKPYLIFVIENIGRMKIEAMNVLLKTLEEPFDCVYFFMTANREEDIIPTIRSRAHVTNFYTVPNPEILSACKESVYAAELVNFSLGRPGKLLRLMEDMTYFNLHREMYAEVNRFLENPTLIGAFEIIKKYADKNIKEELLDLLLSRSRSLALTNEASSPALAHLDFTVVAEEIEKAKDDIMGNVNSKLVLENLLIPFVA